MWATLIKFSWWVRDRIGSCAVLLIAGLHISALEQPPTGFLPKPVAIPPPPPRPYPLSVLIRRPSPLLPYAPSSLLPPPPFPPSSLPVTLPVNHTFHFGSPSPPTLVPSFTVSPCPFRPSSVLQTSVGPGLLIPSAFYTPPALNYPTYPTPPLPNT